MDKGAKDKFAGSLGENGGGWDAQKTSSLKNWKGRDEEEGPGNEEEKKYKEIFKCWE
jgi:hypothetical protein